MTQLEAVHASKDPIHAEKAKIMEEEYLMVRQMRHKLRYLLEEQDLENRISKLFTIKKIIQNPKSLNIYDEVKNFNDNNRSLLLSEGRSYVQEWCHAIPK